MSSLRKFQMMERYEQFSFPEKYRENFDKLTLQERIEIAQKSSPLYAGKDWDEVQSVDNKLRLEAFYIFFNLFRDEELFKIFAQIMLEQDAFTEQKTEDFDLFDYNAVKTRNLLENIIEEKRYHLNKALKRKLENKNGVQ